MRARASSRLFGLWLTLAAASCEKQSQTAGADAPDDIDAIERTLADRDRELAEHGVVVAYRGAPPATEEPSAPTEAHVGAGEDSELQATTTSDAPQLPQPVAREYDAPDSDESLRSRRIKGKSKRLEAGAPTKCERICALAESTCDLRDHVCRLAGRHPGDVRYARSCQRAQDQCDAARSQCEACAV